MFSKNILEQYITVHFTPPVNKQGREEGLYTNIKQLY